MIREKVSSLFYFVGGNDGIVGGVVSLSTVGKWYIKSFVINKFKIVI
jgi:hypothetical protein